MEAVRAAADSDPQRSCLSPDGLETTVLTQKEVFYLIPRFLSHICGGFHSISSVAHQEK